MRWSDIPRNPGSRTLRQFAVGWLLFLLGLAAWHGLHRPRPVLGIVLAALALLGGAAGLLKPSLLRWVFRGWMMLAFPIGWLISQLVLLILFYGVFTPMALFLRLRGRDSLRLRRPPSADGSLWQRKDTPLDLQSYFRQY